MPNKDECLNAIDVIVRYCNEVKQGHVPPRFELTNELDVLMQLVQGHFAKSKVTMDDPITICQCCEYLATMIDDKELIKTIDYIEERATAMYNKLIERKAQVKRLEKAFDKACEKLSEVIDIEGCNGFCENYTESERNGCKCGTKKFWKVWCLQDEGGDR